MPDASPATEAGGLRGRLGATPGPLVLVAVGLSYLALSRVVMVLQGPDANDIRTGADGVTRIGQLHALIGLGCDVAQGPLLGRPKSADQVRRRRLTSGRTWIDEAVRTGNVADVAATLRGAGEELPA